MKQKLSIKQFSMAAMACMLILGTTLGFDTRCVEAKSKKLYNTEKTISGKELSEQEKKKNDIFRGDKYSRAESFDKSVPSARHKALVEANYVSTCKINANLDGEENDNSKYTALLSDEQKEDVKELKELRNSISDIDGSTIMQKVITPEQYKSYTDKKEPRTVVSGAAARAKDAAVFMKNVRAAYKHLRLDYQGTVFKTAYENKESMYVMRFTTNDFPSNNDYPKMDGSEPWNKPPCTGLGFTASPKFLIPEYTYGRGKDIADGAIYKVDYSGAETLVAIWDRVQFVTVE